MLHAAIGGRRWQRGASDGAWPREKDGGERRKGARLGAVGALLASKRGNGVVCGSWGRRRKEEKGWLNGVWARGEGKEKEEKEISERKKKKWFKK